MCAACVAQGSVYVGGAVVSLRVMAARAATRRAAIGEDAKDADGDASADEAVVSSAAPGGS